MPFIDAGNVIRTTLFPPSTLQLILDAQRSIPSLPRQNIDHQIVRVAYDCDYKVYEHTSENPDLVLVGYNFFGQKVRKTTALISELAARNVFEEYVLLADGYRGRSRLPTAYPCDAQLYIDALSNIFWLHPEGNDSEHLRERQFRLIRELSDKQLIGIGAVDCLLEREDHFFLPHIRSHLERGHKIVYLLEQWHVLSPFMNAELQREKVGYVGLVV